MLTSIIGLDRLGTSLGMALAAQRDWPVIAFDAHPDAVRAAQSCGAIKRAQPDLQSAVKDADLVVLAVPLADQHQTLAAIAPHLRPGGVVVSLAPLLTPLLTWAGGSLPADYLFVAAHPVLNPARVAAADLAPRADLFAHGEWSLATASASVSDALKLVSSLAITVGAAPHAIDPVDHDVLMGGAESVPVLLAWALMQTTTTSMSWDRMRKLTAAEFATATAALDKADVNMLFLNRDNAVRALDRALAAAQSLRAKIVAREDQTVSEALTEAAARRAKWLAEHESGAKSAPGVDLGQLFARRKKHNPKPEA